MPPYPTGEGAAVTPRLYPTDKSLLSVGENGRFGRLSTPRYQIHKLLRQFSAEKLAESTVEDNDAHQKYCQDFLNFVAAQVPALQGSDVLAALKAIERDIENVRTAVRWAATYQPHHFSKPFGVSLELFYFVKGWFLESETIFKLISDKLAEQYRVEGQETNPAVASKGYLHWIQYRTNLGVAQFHLGHHQAAQQTHQQSLSLLPKNDVAADWVRAWCLFNLGYSAQHNYEAMLNFYQESKRLADRVEDSWLHAISLVFQGNGLRVIGKFDEAKPVLEKSLQILDDLGERVFSNFAMSNLGRLAKDCGDLSTSKAYHLECLTQRRTLGIQLGIAWAFWDLGRVTLLQEKYQEARDYFQQAIALGKEANLAGPRGVALWGLGNVALASGDFQQAERYYQESKRFYDLAPLSGGPGWAAAGLGNFTRAEQYLIADLHNMNKARNVPKGFDALAGLALITAKKGLFDQALELLALVRHHSASTYENKKKAGELWQELSAELPDHTIAKAEKQGKKRDFMETVEQFIKDSQPQ